MWPRPENGIPPASNQRVIDLGQQGELVLFGGNLSTGITNLVTLDSRNRVSSAPANKLSLSFTSSSGLFRGSSLNSVTRKTQAFQGVLLKQSNYGVGYFIGPNGQGGLVFFGPQP